MKYSIENNGSGVCMIRVFVPEALAAAFLAFIDQKSRENHSTSGGSTMICFTLGTPASVMQYHPVHDCSVCGCVISYFSYVDCPDCTLWFALLLAGGSL